MEEESGELGCGPALGAYCLGASLSLGVFLCKMGHSYLSSLPYGVVINDNY